MANVLTFVRLLAAAPFGLAMAGETRGAAIVSALFLGLAIATDLLDGPLARRRGTVSRTTQAFDHTTDFLFVTVGLAAAAMRGAVPALLPLLIAVSFAQYLIDSFRVHRGSELHMSALGRMNGILYFAPLGGDIGVRLGIPQLATSVRTLAWALILTTLLSMVDRWRRLPRARRRARGSPSGGTRAQSPR